MNTVRIWRSADAVATEWTQRLREYLRWFRYPEDIIEVCEIRFDRNTDSLYFYTESDDFVNYEYGDGERPPLGAMRNFFFKYSAEMTRAVDTRLAEEVLNALSIQ